MSLTSEHRGTAELRVTEDEKCYLRFTPNTVTGPGPVSSTLFTEGYEEMSIPVETLKSGLPDWIDWELPEADSPPGNPYNLVVAPSTDTPQQIEFRFTVDEREPTCVDQPARDARHPDRRCQPRPDGPAHPRPQDRQARELWLQVHAQQAHQRGERAASLSTTMSSATPNSWVREMERQPRVDDRHALHGGSRQRCEC